MKRGRLIEKEAAIKYAEKRINIPRTPPSAYLSSLRSRVCIADRYEHEPLLKRGDLI